MCLGRVCHMLWRRYIAICLCMIFVVLWSGSVRVNDSVVNCFFRDVWMVGISCIYCLVKFRYFWNIGRFDVFHPLNELAR